LCANIIQTSENGASNNRLLWCALPSTFRMATSNTTRNVAQCARVSGASLHTLDCRRVCGNSFLEVHFLSVAEPETCGSRS